jgi:hypothetical protein
LESFLLIKQHTKEEIEKGKMIISHEVGFKEEKAKRDERQKVRKKWYPPRQGELQLNVDGSWSTPGSAGVGMVLRNHLGEVVVAACRHVLGYWDATEAQLATTEDGMKLLLTWTN